MSHWSRRVFLAGSAGSVLALPGVAGARGIGSRVRVQDDDDASAVHAGFPANDPALVREIVGKSHSDLDAVTELVTTQPALAKASWDWGFGDWESALGAASHVGRPDIVEVLVAHGARPNLFTFAMLGQVDVVRAAVEANPGVQRVPGPHGITLLAHARMGGDNAAGVLEYLESLGDADARPPRQDTPEDLKQSILGAYVHPGAPRMEVVEQRNGNPSLRIGEGFGRGLTYTGDHAFYPAGAPSVRINFHIEGGRAITMTIHDGALVLTAKRLED